MANPDIDNSTENLTKFQNWQWFKRIINDIHPERAKVAQQLSILGKLRDWQDLTCEAWQNIKNVDSVAETEESKEPVEKGQGKRQVGFNTENTLNSELKSLSEKIRQYRSGKGVPEKSVAPDSMKGRVDLLPDGTMFGDAAEYDKPPKFLDYKAAYKDAWDKALKIMQKFTGLTGLPKNESDPMIGLRYLEEWCYANIQRVAAGQSALPKPEETEPDNEITGTKKKKRPTKAEMENRNRVVAYAAGKIKVEHGRLPTVDEIIKETELTRNQVYATTAYKEGKIAKNPAILTTESIGGSVTSSEQFKDRSIEHTRANKRSKSDQAELDAMIDEQQ